VLLILIKESSGRVIQLLVEYKDRVTGVRRIALMASPYAF
jgi:hypothetical protein